MNKKHLLNIGVAVAVLATGRYALSDKAVPLPGDFRDAPNSYGALSSEAGGKKTSSKIAAASGPEFTPKSGSQVDVDNAIFASIARKYHILLEPRSPIPGQYVAVTNRMAHDASAPAQLYLDSRPAPKGVTISPHAVPGQIANQILTDRGLIKHTLTKEYYGPWKASTSKRIDIMVRDTIGVESPKPNDLLVDVFGYISFRNFAYKGRSLPRNVDPRTVDFAKTKYGSMLVPMPASEEDWYAYGYPEITVTAQKSQLHQPCPQQFNEEECAEWDENKRKDTQRVYNGGAHEFILSPLGDGLPPRVMCGTSPENRKVMPGNGGCGNQYGTKLKTTQCYRKTMEQVELCDNEHRLVALPVHAYHKVNGRSIENFLYPLNGVVWFLRGDGKFCYTDYPPAAGACMYESEYIPFSE